MQAEASQSPFVRRNFALGVANGALFQGALKLVDPAAVLTLLAYGLTQSPLLAGLIAAAFTVGWHWPPLLISPWVEKSPRSLPLYRYGAAVRLACYALGASVLLSPFPKSSPVHAYWLLVLLGLVQSSAGGLTFISFMDVVGRTIPAHRRGIFFGMRLTFGEGLGLVAAGVLGYILSDRSGLSFPANFGMLFLIYIFAGGMAHGSFSLVHEPDAPVASRRLSFAFHLARLRRICQRDRSYRNFLLVRIVNGLGAMYVPLLVVYGTHSFGLTPSAVAVFLAVQSGAVLVSNPLWAFLSDRRGSRAMLRIGLTLGLGSVLTVLTVGILPAVRLGPMHTDLRILAVGAAFAISGLASRAWQLGDAAYLLDLAPYSRIPTYVGLGQLAALPLALGPIPAGLIAQALSFPSLFAFCAVAVAGALALAFVGLGEPGEETPAPISARRVHVPRHTR